MRSTQIFYVSDYVEKGVETFKIKNNLPLLRLFIRRSFPSDHRFIVIRLLYSDIIATLRYVGVVLVFYAMFELLLNHPLRSFSRKMLTSIRPFKFHLNRPLWASEFFHLKYTWFFDCNILSILPATSIVSEKKIQYEFMWLELTVLLNGKNSISHFILFLYRQILLFFSICVKKYSVDQSLLFFNELKRRSIIYNITFEIIVKE